MKGSLAFFFLVQMFLIYCNLMARPTEATWLLGRLYETFFLYALYSFRLALFGVGKRTIKQWWHQKERESLYSYSKACPHDMNVNPGPQKSSLFLTNWAPQGISRVYLLTRYDTLF